MSNKFKIFSVILIMISIMFFGNINNVDADTSYNVSDGYAACYYYGFYDYNEDVVDAYGRHPGDEGYDPSGMEGYSTGDYYSVYIYAYKDADWNSNKRVWAELYLQENVQEQNLEYGALISQYKTNIDNHNEVFVAENIWDRFNSDGTYKCPSQIYAYKTMVSLSGCPRNVADGDTCATLINSPEHSSISNENGNFTVTDPQPGGWRNFYIDTHDTVVDENNPNAQHTNTDLIDMIKKAITGDSLDKLEPGTACTILKSNTVILAILKFIIWAICVGAIVVLIIMTMMDFVKAITGSDDTGLKKAFQRLIKRVIATVILILLPLLLTFIINIANDNLSEVGEVKIGADGEPYCGIVE